MLRHLFVALMLSAVALWGTGVSAATLDVTDVTVSIQAEDAVKARDTAILQAQRQALAVLVGATELPASVTDSQVARLVSGFSVRNERVTGRSYNAFFTVRFNSIATQNFAHSQNMTIDPYAIQGRPVSASGKTAEKPSLVGTVTTPDGEVAQVAPVTVQNIVVLPVLDIGARRVVWDEPNPWREVWQQSDHSVRGMPVRVPLGDISDISDIPDAGFLTGGTANIAPLLERYGAKDMYVIVAKNQGAALDPSGGMALSLYRHNGRKLQFIRKNVMRPRPGYLFNDSVPAALQMIIMAENRNQGETADDVVQPRGMMYPEAYSENSDETLREPTSLASVATPQQQPQPAIDTSAHTAGTPVVVTVPYQSLVQWVSIQKRVRQVHGVKMIVPAQVSPSSAQLKIITSVTLRELAANMAMQGFELKSLPNGELALVDR